MNILLLMPEVTQQQNTALPLPGDLIRFSYPGQQTGLPPMAGEVFTGDSHELTESLVLPIQSTTVAALLPM